MTQPVEKPLEQAPDEHFDHERKDLLVATPHAALVVATLLDLGLPEPRREDSALLGLTKITFKDPVNTEGPVEKQATEYLARVGGVISKGDPIGMVLSAVKQSISGDWAGWIPTMGRNRTLGHVTGTDGGPIISGGDPELLAIGDRRPASRFDELKGFVERGAVVTLPGDGVRIGVVDTTLHFHPWLTHARVQPQPVPYGTVSPQDVRASHSAAMAGIILRKAPGASIDIVGVLGDEGWSTSWNAANAIASFGSTDIDILNLSFTCYTDNGEPPLALATAIDRLNPRTVVVAAAGNFGGGNTNASHPMDLRRAPAWPAALDDVIAVGAVVPAAEPGIWRTADFSPKTPWVDVVAPGTGVTSLLIGAPDGVADAVTGATSSLPVNPRFAQWSGTSPATAFVTGTIAEQMTSNKVSAKVAWNRLEKSLTALGGGLYNPKLLA